MGHFEKCNHVCFGSYDGFMNEDFQAIFAVEKFGIKQRRNPALSWMFINSVQVGQGKGQRNTTIFIT